MTSCRFVASFWARKRAKPYPSNLWSSAQFHLQLLNPTLRWNLKDLKLQTENSNSKQIAISIFLKKNHMIIHGCVVQSCWISFRFGWSTSVWKSSRPRTRIGDQPQGRTNLIQQFQTHVEDLLVVCESAAFFLSGKAWKKWQMWIVKTYVWWCLILDGHNLVIGMIKTDVYTYITLEIMEHIHMYLLYPPLVAGFCQRYDIVTPPCCSPARNP